MFKSASLLSGGADAIFVVARVQLEDRCECKGPAVPMCINVCVVAKIREFEDDSA